MTLPCGCASHTTGFQIVVGDWSARKECLDAQAELERRAAVYDAALDALREAKKTLEDIYGDSAKLNSTYSLICECLAAEPLKEQPREASEAK